MAKRLLSGILIVFGVVSLVFFVFQIMPGDPVVMMMGQRSDEATENALRKELGLNEPLVVQFGYYLNDVSPLSFHEDSDDNQKKYDYFKIMSIGSSAMVVKTPFLRRSFQSNRLVTELLSDSILNTLWLAISAMALASLLGIFMGVVAALNQGGWLDRLVVSISIFGISVPSFVSGVLISVLFGIYLRDYTGLDPDGFIVDVDPFEGYVLRLRNLILPTITLGIRPLGIITQLTRSSMIGVWQEDYIRTAKAKGLSTWSVVRKHALKNALNPVVTAVSGWFASLLAGAFFVEAIFNWPGLGGITITAIDTRDFPIIMGATLFVAVIFVVINILVDVVYAWLDPRVRL